MQPEIAVAFGFHLDSMLAVLDADATPTSAGCAGVIRELRKQLSEARHYADTLALNKGPTLTHLWGQPVSEMRHALEFLEQHTGTTEIRASVKRLTLALKGQRDLIAEQSFKNGKLEAENAELRREWASLQAIREGLHRELDRLREQVEK
jgi:predicted RNase H-like nuclease (RuvC/YqgF family)